MMPAREGGVCVFGRARGREAEIRGFFWSGRFRLVLRVEWYEPCKPARALAGVLTGSLAAETAKRRVGDAIFSGEV